ncbi:hypothetical protein [Tepidibacter hydrothermalis]|uniref:Uncharacterized protein n=1 Tax=Tepidibacter hydrothermalis TaxID=3036126 RepID=A0ABY8EIB3_9FIRM|nr:hypothetical protein [Tepidibacter hydrothermalis]WFD11404.1 hypothetical protein P4S50_04825 [Tepidibacter hydrothermalis]
MPDQATVGAYIITFISNDCRLESGELIQEWVYTVQEDPESQLPYNISHLELELCPEFNVSDLMDGDIMPGGSFEFGPGNDNCVPDGILRVKWDELTDSQIQPYFLSGGKFSFIVKGCFDKEEKNIYVKGGPNCFPPSEDPPITITGPSCNTRTTTTVPPPRGIPFKGAFNYKIED